MAMIEWNDSLSVYIEKIDRQHKGLIDMVNRVYDLMIDGGNNKSRIMEIISEDILNFLNNWLVKHIYEMDKKLGIYLKDNMK
jgi:hemerythrin